MRFRLLMLLILLGVATATPAQVNISIKFSLFPELVQVPGYPVYYAPRQAANYFFYDGMYWVYQDDDWYSSSWYNGPWWRAAPEYVPVYVLRVPVRYYRRPPAYFQAWRRDAPPRWGEHWGRDWEQRRSGWDKWDRRAVPAPAPLPTYQRKYSGDRYPRVEQQHALNNQNYRYKPKDALVREHIQQTQGTPAPSAREKQQEPQRKDSGQDARERVQRRDPARSPAQQAEPAGRQQRPQTQAETPREAAAIPRKQETPKSQAKESEPRGKGAASEPGGKTNRGRDKGPQKAREKDEERDREPNK